MHVMATLREQVFEACVGGNVATNSSTCMVNLFYSDSKSMQFV